eukprot:1468391-Rhodomonas_salina.1
MPSRWHVSWHITLPDARMNPAPPAPPVTARAGAGREAMLRTGGRGPVNCGASMLGGGRGGAPAARAAAAACTSSSPSSAESSESSPAWTSHGSNSSLGSEASASVGQTPSSL